MASIVFSTLGQAVGGPFGAAVGALAGGAVDGALFGRGAGPALQDPLVQKSAYGVAIPRLFGRTRHAGVVIWARPMVRGGGKGEGRRAYTMSFAVALSARKIERIGRIWADGREIRNAQGEFETAIRMRVYSSFSRRETDPAIVAAEGFGAAPAYLGLSHVVFEDFPLGDFGNRIPNLSFEVVCDAETSGAWLAELAGLAGVSAEVSADMDNFQGFTAISDRLVEDIKSLSQVADLAETYRAGTLRLTRVPRQFSVPLSAFVSRPDAVDPVRQTAYTRRPAGVVLDYMDSEREFQIGSQRISRGGAGEALRQEIPVATTASSARGLANRIARSAEAAIDRLEFSLSWHWLEVEVGDILTLEGRPERWRIVQREIAGLEVRLLAQRVALRDVLPERPSEPGRSLPAPTMQAGPSEVQLFEMPVQLDGGMAGIWISATGGPDWRGAEIFHDLGFERRLLGRVVDRVSRGTLLANLPVGPACVWDEENVIEFRAQESSPPFESRLAGEVLDGANILRIGQEFLQFREILHMESDRIILRGLLRGRFGTEYAIENHAVGSTVLQIARSNLQFLPMNIDSYLGNINFIVESRGDPVGGIGRSYRFQAIGSGCLAPVHLRYFRDAEGNFTFSWISRSPDNFNWSSELMDLQSIHLVRFSLVDSNENYVEKTISGNAFFYSVEEQNSDFGFLPIAIDMLIVKEGYGPEIMRRSGPMRVS